MTITIEKERLSDGSLVFNLLFGDGKQSISVACVDYPSASDAAVDIRKALERTTEEAIRIVETNKA